MSPPVTIVINLGERTFVLIGCPPWIEHEDGVACRLSDTGDGRIRVCAEIDVELLRSQDSYVVVRAQPPSVPTRPPR